MITSMFTRAFWAGAFERAVKTFAQALLAGLGIGTGLFHVDWLTVLDMAAGATLVSVLTSLATVTSVTATSPLPLNQLPGPVTAEPIVPPQPGPAPRS